MDPEIVKSVILFIIIPGVLAPIGYIMKKTFEKVEYLQKDLATKVDEEQARQIVRDQVNPLKDDLVEIKDRLENKLDRIYDLLMKR